jgi:predicted kinase
VIKEKKMTILYVLIGIPGSGKSTWAKRKEEEVSAEWISRDKIRFGMLQEGDDYFAHENKVFAKYVDEIQLAIDSGAPYVIADATHITRGSRNKLLRNLDTTGVEICYVYFATDVETAIERNNQRIGRALVPETAIREMAASLDLPTNFLLVDKDGKEVHV